MKSASATILGSSDRTRSDVGKPTVSGRKLAAFRPLESQRTMSKVKSSKFVSQPLLDPIVTVVQFAVHSVAIVSMSLAGTETVISGFPTQLRVTAAAEPPPLKARRLTSLLGVRNS